MRPFPAVVTLALLLAGCGAPPEPSTETNSLTTITDPAQGRTDPSLGEHVHNYWGSQQRITVLDMTQEVLGWTTVGDGSSPAAIFRPASGDVVPQGTASIELTLDWEDGEATNHYPTVEVWLKTAADREPQLVAAGERGAMLQVSSSNEANDLPHQVLSGWEVQWRIGPGAGGQFTRFSGEVRAHMVAVRGLDIPVYPGHPDRWDNKTEMNLFEASGTTIADGDVTGNNYRCYSPCPPLLVPADGVVIPWDADHVRIVLERETEAPTRLGLKYHDATTWDWTLAEPTEESSTSRTYILPVGSGGDGPYASQSQWEFQLVIEDPVPNGAVAESYVAIGTVYRVS